MEIEKKLTVHPETSEQWDALTAFMQALKIKYEISNEEIYDPEFVAKVRESEEQYKKGEFERVEKKDIKRYLGQE